MKEIVKVEMNQEPEIRERHAWKKKHSSGEKEIKKELKFRYKCMKLSKNKNKNLKRT